MVKVPPGTGTMSKVTLVPGMVSVYGATAAAAAACLEPAGALDRASGAATRRMAAAPAPSAPATRAICRIA
jgi:hypothetical protein